MSNGTYERIKIFCDTLPLKNSLIQGENLEESEQPGEYIFMKNGLVSWHKLNIPSFASLISVLWLLPCIHCSNCSRLNQVWSLTLCRRGRRAWPTASTADPLHHHHHQHHHKSHLQCQQSMCLINVKSCILLNKPDEERDATFSNLSIRTLHICLDPTLPLIPWLPSINLASYHLPCIQALKISYNKERSTQMSEIYILIVLPLWVSGILTPVI